MEKDVEKSAIKQETAVPKNSFSLIDPEHKSNNLSIITNTIGIIKIPRIPKLEYASENKPLLALDP